MKSEKVFYGHKVYFDKDLKKFRYEKETSKVERLSPDAAIVWRDDLKRAIQTAEFYNKTRLGEIRICKGCGQPFFLSEERVRWFEEREMIPPVRCMGCAKSKKNS